MNALQSELLEYLRNTPVIDTHEHLSSESLQPVENVLGDYTRHYFNCDLISAGMPPEYVQMLADASIDPVTKWKKVGRWWDLCRHTGYGQMLDVAVRELYGADQIDGDTVEMIEHKYQQMRKTPGYAMRLMRERLGIEHCMNNIWRLDLDSEDGFYWFMTQIDSWVAPDAKAVSGVSGIEEWARLAVDTLAEDLASRGAKGLKSTLAYSRTLQFDVPEIAQARKGFELIQRGAASTDGRAVMAAQNYIMHEILRFANERGLLLQIHTGYQEGNANTIANSNPLLLNDLLARYPNIRFDLFHIGYPYCEAAGALGKMFTNVRIDMCWAHILSPLPARRALKEYLTLMPVNKIFAFGGDCLFYDGVAGHIELARRSAAYVLAELVEEGVFTLERAKWAGRRIFYENQKEFYGMD